jgi:hypothetical protein
MGEYGAGPLSDCGKVGFAPLGFDTSRRFPLNRSSRLGAEAVMDEDD